MEEEGLEMEFIYEEDMRRVIQEDGGVLIIEEVKTEDVEVLKNDLVSQKVVVVDLVVEVGWEGQN